MKKIQLLLIALVIGIASAQANPVNASVAQKVALNFYATTHSSGTPELSLAYTEHDANGTPVYYVFDVNGAKGFIIVSADDASHPIIGYSDEGAFVIPASPKNSVYFWLGKSKEQIIALRAQNIAATSGITAEWTGYTSGNTSRTPHSAAYKENSNLCQTYWNQEPFYNAMCPGGSVTGCVATAMAQIMRYWQYPSMGSGSNCYNDETPYFSENYGEQCAEFDTSHYVWSEMPNNIGQDNEQIAKLMYDCGVSVDMDYSPTGSGAQVIGGGASAFNAYTTYFGYDKDSINVAYYSNYTDSTWFNLLKNEFIMGRPVQFQGFDLNEGGHSWVGDGYSALTMIHMNWGWGNQDDGWYYVYELNPAPFNFTYGIAVIYGIQPPPSASLGVAKVSKPSAIEVYPNPGKGIFNFTFTNDNNTYQIRVYNVLGQEVNASSISSSANEINLSGQPKGIYIYRILTQTGTPVSTGRLVVE